MEMNDSDVCLLTMKVIYAGLVVASGGKDLTIWLLFGFVVLSSSSFFGVRIEQLPFLSRHQMLLYDRGRWQI